MAEAQKGRDLFSEGVLVDLDVGFWSGQKKLAAKDLGLDEKELPEVFSLGRKRLVPTEALGEIRRIESRAREAVEQNSHKFPIGGAQFVPIKRFVTLAAALDGLKAEFDREADAFCKGYQKFQDEVRPEYGKAADLAYEIHKDRHGGRLSRADFTANFVAALEAAYPSPVGLRERFHFTWSVFEISMPGSSATGRRVKVAEAVAEGEKIQEIEQEKRDAVYAARQEYQRRVQEQIDKFAADVVTGLRQKTVEVCQRVAEFVKDGNVRETSLDSIRSFIEQFSDLNFVGDEEIETQLSNLRKTVLNGHTAEQYRNDAQARKALVEALDGVSATAKALTTEERQGMVGMFSVGRRLVG
jgi:hypothetical protein